MHLINLIICSPREEHENVGKVTYMYCSGIALVWLEHTVNRQDERILWLAYSPAHQA
jgi:hypothetical protein